MKTGVSAQDHPNLEPMDRITVVIPVLNEREMLPGFLNRVHSLSLPLNLIFVDNGSNLKRSGFDHVVELAAKVARRGILIGEVPVVHRVIIHSDTTGAAPWPVNHWP